MQVFVRVAQHMGFAAAARDLQMSPGAVTKHVNALESRIGTRLFDRTTRRVGLTAFGDRYPHQLSGGQRKRVGLAQVLIRDPKILLMDEPFGPLDAQTRQIMGNLLLELWNADRKAVLFVTHDLEEAIALADRVVIMSAGPSARIIGDWRVTLPRPRDISEVRMEKQFHELHREIWSVLKDEVMKGYAQSTLSAEAV
jgi:NitT/TauT family transport system ATP-binding protein